jgi:hypothetical protein
VPRSLSATFQTNATLSSKPTGDISPLLVVAECAQGTR